MNKNKVSAQIWKVMDEITLDGGVITLRNGEITVGDGSEWHIHIDQRKDLEWVLSQLRNGLTHLKERDLNEDK